VACILGPAGHLGEADQADADEAAEEGCQAVYTSISMLAAYWMEEGGLVGGTHPVADESSFSTRVHVMRWQNGQSIHLGWSLRASSGVTVAGAVAAAGCGWLLVAVAFSGTGSGGICTGGASGLSIVRKEDKSGFGREHTVSALAAAVLQYSQEPGSRSTRVSLTVRLAGPL
jgi:hypothetical protein